jgi:cytochrome c-type biogenesis protein CcmH
MKLFPKPEHQVLSRRQLVQRGLTAMLGPVLLRPPHHSVSLQGPGAQDTLAGLGATGTLRDPSVVGRSRAPTDPRENDAQIQAIEQRLACNCGCTLDVFTCRTTDFSCTYSPALHREVLALRNQGKTADQILDAFVAKYGEKALMAPKPQGFNLAGYLLPGVLIASAGAGLVLFIGHRKAAVAQSALETAPSPAPETLGAPQELDRLKRELAQLED